MLSVAAAVILIALASASDHWCPEDIDPPDDLALDVAKCCFKGQQLDATGEKCVERAGSPTEFTQWEALTGAPPAYWLPPALARREGVRAWYNHSCTFHKWLSAVVPLPNDTSAQVVEAFLRVNASAHRFELGPFGGRVRAFSVWKQSYCFDATADGARPLALVTTLQLRTLFKCCAGGKQLDARGERCVARPGERASDAETDVLSPWERPGALYWLPQRLADSVVEVSYDKGPAPSDNPKSDADDEHWELMETANWAFKVRRHPQASTNATDTNHSALANGPDGVTGSYCFDAAEQGGAMPPRVLVTKVAKVNKCCRQGEHLDARALSCEKDPELHGVAEEAVAKGDLEQIRFLADASAEGWLPPELRRARVPVRFLDAAKRQALLGAPGRQAFSARHAASWEIETYDFEVPKLSLTVATPSGGSAVARANSFCIDVVRSGPLAPRVLIADVCGVPGFACLPKCCPAGELLSARGRCRPHGLPAQPDWTPLASALNASLPDNGGHGGRALDNPLCWNYRFTLEPVPSSAADFKQRLTNNQERHRFLTRYYCADYIENGNDVIETLAYCNMPPSGPLYEMVRPLQVVAALLLGVSVASLLSRADTRSSTHGRALAAHAACLAASNGLQAFWFFSHNAAHCETFAFSIYFFLVAAGFWLHVVSLNMARGFARPLGALERAAAGAAGAGAGAGGRRFVLMALYAWGGAALLTAVATSAYRFKAHAPRWLTPPSFFETRTCFVENVYTTDAKAMAGAGRAGGAWGALVYYYAPMGLLVAGNAVCLAFTAARIRRLRRDASVLQRGAAAKPAARSPVAQSVVLYVKLLVSAGLLELLLEATAWAARSRRFHGPPNQARFYFLHNAYVFEIAGTLVDLGRAVAVSWLCRWRCSSLGDKGATAVAAAAAEAALWRWRRKWRTGLPPQGDSAKAPEARGSPVVKAYKNYDDPL